MCLEEGGRERKGRNNRLTFPCPPPADTPLCDVFLAGLVFVPELTAHGNFYQHTMQFLYCPVKFYLLVSWLEVESAGDHMTSCEDHMRKKVI